MPKGKQKPTNIVRVGEYEISTDGVQYIVDQMGLPDTSSHFFEGDPDKEVSKSRSYYTSFRGLADGVLEKAVKKRFQESGLKGVYNGALRELIVQCNGLLEKDKK